MILDVEGEKVLALTERHLDREVGPEIICGIQRLGKNGIVRDMSMMHIQVTSFGEGRVVTPGETRQTFGPRIPHRE